jgi:hypothetical protein
MTNDKPLTEQDLMRDSGALAADVSDIQACKRMLKRRMKEEADKHITLGSYDEACDRTYAIIDECIQIPDRGNIIGPRIYLAKDDTDD